VESEPIEGAQWRPDRPLTGNADPERTAQKDDDSDELPFN
jgi:hypothetical protein